MEEQSNKENYIENQFNADVPTKISTWTKIKSFLCQEVDFGFSPKQQATFKAISDFWHQDISDEQAHNFMFQEMKF